MPSLIKSTFRYMRIYFLNDYFFLSYRVRELFGEIQDVETTKREKDMILFWPNWNKGSSDSEEIYKKVDYISFWLYIWRRSKIRNKEDEAQE